MTKEEKNEEELKYAKYQRDTIDSMIGGIIAFFVAMDFIWYVTGFTFFHVHPTLFYIAAGYGAALLIIRRVEYDKLTRQH